MNYLGSRHYNTSRGWLYWNWLWWWLKWYILTNLCGTLNWNLNCRNLSGNLTCRDLSLILICRTMNWVLNCETLSLICRTLYCIYNLILSIWISWIRGIWSIHPELNISELFLTSNVSNFHVFIKFYILLLYR